jgi:thiol-disulfide isomerase/thioredoxin
MRGFSVLLASLAIAVASAADDPTVESVSDDAALRARLAEIQESQAATRERFHRSLEAAKTDAESKAAVDRFLAETGAHCDAALSLAEAHPRTPAAAEALQFVVRTARAGPSDHSARAITILARDHVQAEGMGEFGGFLFYFFHWPEAERLLRAVAERHPRRDQRAHATYWLAQYLRHQARMVRRLRDDPEQRRNNEESYGSEALGAVLRDKDPEALDRQVEALLERITTDFGNVKSGGRTLGEIARCELFALRSLKVGQVAPEIVGRDAEGNGFRLSDDRGKVVVLTFCGDWCGPCRAMYPHLRALVERLEGRPFALLSVDTDADVETLRSAIREGQVTWRCWWDGGTEGPITTAWGVSSFPTIFVLDARGVIRYRDLRGPDLDRAVDGLLDEAEQTAGDDRP